ncbi:UNVERIFIED_CONTAM: hypothetical protein Sradi_3287400 [Sesamum radiatum]|uniref:Uncharacterized protein n=1 Tax=Sesamum radiatum TaxID=300843 RepID=A0AAW2R0W6_SESRA
MLSTTAARSILPNPSRESSELGAAPSPVFEGERRREAATPRNSEPYQAILSSTFSGWDSGFLADGSEVGFLRGIGV